MDAPSVSVIIPTYNRRELLRKALDSAKGQTYRDFEILVVDDGSTDDTRLFVEGIAGVRYLFQENGGPAKARNLGIRNARGSMIAFLDSDDLWSPHFLETQVRILNNHREVGLTCTGFTVGKKTPRHFFERQEVILGDLYPKLYKQSFIRTPAVVVRKECLAAVGGFNEAYRWSEDHDLWLRIARKYPLAYVNRSLVTIGRHGDNVSRDLARPLDAHLEVALEVLERNYEASRVTEAIFRARLSKRYLQFSRLYLKRGDKHRAWSCLSKAVSMNPYAWRPYRYLVKSLFHAFRLVTFF